MIIKILNKTAILTGSYIILCVIAFSYHMVRHEYDKFSTIFIGLLTLPWSFIVALMKDIIIANVFHYELNFVGNNIILLVCAMVNTVLIYAVSNKKSKK